MSLGNCDLAHGEGSSWTLGRQTASPTPLDQAPERADAQLNAPHSSRVRRGRRIDPLRPPTIPASPVESGTVWKNGLKNFKPLGALGHLNWKVSTPKSRGGVPHGSLSDDTGRPDCPSPDVRGRWRIGRRVTGSAESGPRGPIGRALASGSA
jgi:hypothetical protein